MEAEQHVREDRVVVHALHVRFIELADGHAARLAAHGQALVLLVDHHVAAEERAFEQIVLAAVGRRDLA